MLTAAWSGPETVWDGSSSSEAVRLGCEAVMKGAGASGGVAAVAVVGRRCSSGGRCDVGLGAPS